MPGKYSHSVVLADYSSRGIINLPNDQHIAYLRSSPQPASQRSRQGSNTWSEISTTAQPRSKSAIACTSRGVPGIDRIRSPTRQLIVDTGIGLGDDGLSGVNDQRPSTSDKSRLSTNRSKQPPPRQLKEPVHARTTTSTPTPETTSSWSKSVPRESRNGSLPNGSNKITRIRAEDFLRGMPPIPSQIRDFAPNPPRSMVTRSLSKEQLSKPGIAADIRSKPSFSSIANGQRSATSYKTSNPLQSPKVVQRQNSHETQFYAPKTVAAEPDFDGFSDVEDQSTSYFEKAPNPIPNTAHRTRQASRLETPSPIGSSARTLESGARTHRSMSTEPSDSEVLAEVGVSPPNSNDQLSSHTSSSTISTRGTAPALRTNKHTDTKKTASQPTTQEWRLPEIDEDGTFDPDFFTQGADDHMLRLSHKDSVDSFLDRPLGTVSAGRDIDFTHDGDAESEADAACPPDIGRFRKDEELESSDLLHPVRGDSIAGNGVISSGQTPKAKKVGFFARLRSRAKQ